MIELEVSSVVLERLKADFPKANAAQRALAKYVTLLSEQISLSVTSGRSTKGFHSISMKQQRNSGQLGPTKIRLQNWLEEHNLQLFKVIEEGSNFTHRNSLIKLSRLALVKQIIVSPPLAGATSAMGNENSNAQSIGNDQFLERLYPGIFELDKEALQEAYDFVPVDIASLSNYTHWLENSATLIGAQKRMQYLEQADTIMRVAGITGGNYLQRKKPSEFGRNYYAGLSVQNVNKELRRAMLGHCWEYDARSAVFAFKMSFASSACDLLGTRVQAEFYATLDYLQRKNTFIRKLRESTFDAGSVLDQTEQEKLVKQAITAIGFGARATEHGWCSVEGRWQNPALKVIFRYVPNAQKSFLNCTLIKQFMKEQRMLDAVIYSQCETKRPEILEHDSVKTKSGRISKAKVMAWLYQHTETLAMDAAAVEIRRRGLKVIARVHDAIFIDKKLDAGTRYDVTEAIKAATGSSYWQLAGTELKAYEQSGSLVSDDDMGLSDNDGPDQIDLTKFFQQSSVLD